MEIGSLAQWVGASATLLAVLVALFKDELLRWRRKPKLTISIALRSPDCQKTFLNYAIQREELFSAIAECYYLRLWVANEGKTRAERVQVFAARLSRHNADGSFKEVEGFLPMNFRWSHAQPGSPEIYAEGISPEMGKHCDLGHVVDPAHNANLDRVVPHLEVGRYILALDLEVAPNTKSHLVPPGVYRLELKVAAANAKPVTKTIELTLTGQWYSDQSRMFADGLGAKVLDS